ncbi:chondroitin synthase [Culex quinquefasciatus]|uniref:Chondroitin synthase n=1 Tax=Culex quinquefasciatus TaxID=7176 RepID=B0WL90_CULQU|nr:chondroitin synthase [Culex quinquefasciatus]|eukprot:XP_001849474.1 chondroitin synthase [Culex quinquefasciatus]
MQNILNKTILVAHRNNPQLEHRGLHSVYRNFDTLRGMNYRMHLSFYDRGRLKHVFNSTDRSHRDRPLAVRYGKHANRHFPSNARQLAGMYKQPTENFGPKLDSIQARSRAKILSERFWPRNLDSPDMIMTSSRSTNQPLVRPALVYSDADIRLG